MGKLIRIRKSELTLYIKTSNRGKHHVSFYNLNLQALLQVQSLTDFYHQTQTQVRSFAIKPTLLTLVLLQIDTALGTIYIAPCTTASRVL
jgi:hypothetical protein